MVSTGENVARRHDRRERLRAYPATPLAQKTSLGADSGASLLRKGRPNACKVVGSFGGFRYMLNRPALPPGVIMNGELGFYSGEGA